MLFVLFHKPTDSSATKSKKNLVVGITGAAIVLSVFSISFTPSTTFMVFYLIGAVVNSMFCIKWLITKNMLNREISFTLFMWLFLVLFSDSVRLSEMRESSWAGAILIVDAMLLCRLHRIHCTCAVLMICLYLFVLSVEKSVRFGLFDIVSGEKMVDLRDCFPSLTQEEIEATPCKQKVATSTMTALYSMSTFILDFFATRTFAVGLENEKAALQASVSLAESVAKSLVNFDLEEAASQIHAETGTPLTAILHQLLQNLHRYRPYLPDSLFERESDKTPESNVQPPQGYAAVLFTDIRSSTAIWEACPDAMKKALKTHNTVLRNCLRDFGGYEVKTIGDSFMVAFGDLTSGCKFAMAVQERLMSTHWPVDLVLPEEFIKNNWSGLMVRIGLHFGEVSTEINELSGRVDYFGRTVNRAARLEGASYPGGIAIDSSLVDQLPTLDGWRSEFVTFKLRGIEEPVEIIRLFQSRATARKSMKSIFAVSVDDSFQMSSDGSMSTLTAVTPFPSDMMERRARSTTCSVRMRIDTTDPHILRHEINISLQKTISCIERTDGVIAAVVSSNITVGWNTVRSSSQHLQQGLRFILLMHRTLSSASIGISSSSTSCGSVGTKEQRFVTVIGDCVTTCGLLCQASRDIGAFALCNSMIRDIPSRPVDRWYLDDGDASTTIYELQIDNCVGGMITVSEEYTHSDMIGDWRWSSDYAAAFNRSDWETIEKMSQNDKVLLAVSNMLRTGTTMRFKNAKNPPH